MIETIKKNYLIFVAFLIPFTFIFIFSFLTLLPRLLVKTDYNFVFYTCHDEFNFFLDRNFCKTNFEKQYQISNKKIIKNERISSVSNFDNNKVENYEPKVSFTFYVFDSKNFKATEITDKDLPQYFINTSKISPDKVEILVKNASSIGFDLPLGSGYSNNQFFFSSSIGTVRLNLIPENIEDSYSFMNSINFLGWIEK